MGQEDKKSSSFHGGGGISFLGIPIFHASANRDDASFDSSMKNPMSRSADGKTMTQPGLYIKYLLLKPFVPGPRVDEASKDRPDRNDFTWAAECLSDKLREDKP